MISNQKFDLLGHVKSRNLQKKLNLNSEILAISNAHAAKRFFMPTLSSVDLGWSTGGRWVAGWSFRLLPTTAPTPHLRFRLGMIQFPKHK